MADIVHSVLAGSEVHEPKGIASASLGQVYVADGNGSGNWTGVGTSSFVGMIVDFPWPVVQEGWLECDGTDINTTTYGALYSVMTIQSSATRTSSSPTLTSIPSTANFRVGYYVFGTGIAAGTTILSIDSGSQVTLSGNAGSSGSNAITVSPWYLNTGTIRLPNLTTNGRFRRSRTTGTAVGQVQADALKGHTHGVSGTTTVESVNHTHPVSGTTGAMNGNQSHSHTYAVSSGSGSDFNYNNGIFTQGNVGANTSTVNTDHTHPVNLTSGGASAVHTHNFSVTSASTGDTETRPANIVFMTCIKY